MGPRFSSPPCASACIRSTIDGRHGMEGMGAEHLDDPGELGTSGFAASLSADELRDLMAMGRRQRFRAGSIIMNEGDTSERVLLLLAGRVKVYSVTESGREVVLAIRSAGDLIGELSAIDSLPHSATADTLDDVEAIVLRAASFRKFLTDHPETALMLLAMVTERLRDADRKRVEFGASDSVGRVAARLVELANRFPRHVEGGVQIDMPFTQVELAGWTGLARESVAKALRHLRDRGWVETRRRSFLVRDLEALRRRAT